MSVKLTEPSLHQAFQFWIRLVRGGMLVPEPFCPLVFRCVAHLEARLIALPFPPSWLQGTSQ